MINCGIGYVGKYNMVIGKKKGYERDIKKIKSLLKKMNNKLSKLKRDTSKINLLQKINKLEMRMAGLQSASNKIDTKIKNFKDLVKESRKKIMSIISQNNEKKKKLTNHHERLLIFMNRFDKAISSFKRNNP